MKKLSIVTTLYQSQEYVREFHSRASAAAHDLVGDSYEVIFVNDGSPDDSLAIATGLAAGDSHVVVVDLSRNFGHHRAMMTGLSFSTGEKVFLVDSDLEESPEWVQLFDQKIQESGADVAYGVQINRRGGWSERFTGGLFYRLFRLATGVAQVDNIVTARLMTRRYVDALVAHQERELNIGGLWVITGFDQDMVEVVKLSHSPSSYSLSRKLSIFVDAITSFSSLPLVAVFYAGLIFTITAAVFTAVLIFRYFVYEAMPDGYTSLIVSIWFFSGLIIFFLGIQGIYIAKVFLEVKQRPYSIVRSVYRSSQGAGVEE